MKLTVFLGLLMSICLLPCVEAFGQSNEKKTCEFNIVGMWRSGATSDTNPVFYGFRQNGSVKVLGHVKDALPQNFEVRAMAGYKLDDPAAESLNQCDEKLKLHTIEGVTAAQNPQQQTLEYVRVMKKKNDDLHIPDREFPTDWRPTALRSN